MASEYDVAQAAATVYAESLLQLANTAGVAEDIASELDQLQALWKSEPAFASMMESAAIDDDARRDSIKRVFGSDRVSQLTLNLMLVLNDKRRSAILPQVCEAYRARLNKQQGRENVYITSATPLEDNHRDAIRREIQRLTGKEGVLVETVDPEVLGGLTVQVADRLFDLTVKRRLSKLRGSLLESTDRNMRDDVSRFVTEG